MVCSFVRGSEGVAYMICRFDKVANGDRSKYKFRCDNPDGNCALPGTYATTINLEASYADLV